MCNAFSCIVDREKNVTWKFGTDSHDKLLEIAGIKDDTIDPALIKFCRVEISPKNKDYLNPDKWVFKIDMDVLVVWWYLLLEYSKIGRDLSLLQTKTPREKMISSNNATRFLYSGYTFEPVPRQNKGFTPIPSPGFAYLRDPLD